MQWNNLREFLAMGGYALYVWTSFGVTALCMMVEVMAIRQRHRAVSKLVRAGHSSDKEIG
ncbi:heme exporter protein CcmD [Petrachloros mirabilis]